MENQNSNKILFEDLNITVILISGERTFVGQEVLRTLRHHFDKTETIFLKNNINKDQFDKLVKKSATPLIILPLQQANVFDIYEFNTILQIPNRKKFLILTLEQETFSRMVQKYNLNIIKNLVTYNFIEIKHDENMIILELITAFRLNPIYFTYLFSKLGTFKRYDIYERLDKEELSELIHLLKKRAYKKIAA